jgi:hypothetical protein
MKTKTFLIAAVMFFALSVAAFAQGEFGATYTVGSSPVTTVVESGHTEKAGDITFTTVPFSAPTVTSTITIDYTIPITLEGVIIPNNADPGTNLPDITIQGPEGPNDNQIVIRIIPDTVDPSMMYSFIVRGVRVDVADDPGATPLTAFLSTVDCFLESNQNSARVINAAAPGLDGFTGTGPVRVNAVTGAIDGSDEFYVSTMENFRNVFGLTNVTDASQTVSTMLKIHLNQNPPEGISVCFDNEDWSGRFQTASYTGTVLNENVCIEHNDDPDVYYRVIEDTDNTAVEDFDTDVWIVTDLAEGESYPVGEIITAYITLAPIQGENNSNWDAIPRYAEVPVGNVAL